MTTRPPEASVAMSVKSSVKVNFPSPSKLTAQPPTVMLSVTTSPSPEWLCVERRESSPPQPRSESIATAGRRAGVPDPVARTWVIQGEGSGGIVSSELEADVGSMPRGAAAASGTTTTIAAIHAGNADRADSVSRRRRVSSTSSKRVASCAGRAIATLASAVARAARRSRAISSKCVA